MDQDGLTVGFDSRWLGFRLRFPKNRVTEMGPSGVPVFRPISRDFRHPTSDLSAFRSEQLVVDVPGRLELAQSAVAARAVEVGFNADVSQQFFATLQIVHNRGDESGVTPGEWRDADRQGGIGGHLLRQRT